VALDDGLAHVGNAGNDGVAGEVGFDGGDGRVLDVARRGEMGLAGAEVDQVGALGAQLGGLGGHGHGCGDFNAADAVGEDLAGAETVMKARIRTEFQVSLSICCQFGSPIHRPPSSQNSLPLPSL
jgi:hypothetical protein